MATGYDFTPRSQLRTPRGGNLATAPADMQYLANQLDDVAHIESGLLSERPAAASVDNFYFATDAGPDGSGILYRDTGSNWIPIGPGVIPDDSVTRAKIGEGQVYKEHRGEGLAYTAADSFDGPTATGVLNVTGLGFRPSLVRTTFAQDFNTNSNAGIGNGAGALVVADNSIRRWAAWSLASGGSSIQRFVQTRVIYMVAVDGTIQLAADLTAFLADGFTLNFTVATGVATKIGWEAVA